MHHLWCPLHANITIIPPIIEQIIECVGVNYKLSTLHRNVFTTNSNCHTEQRVTDVREVVGVGLQLQTLSFLFIHFAQKEVDSNQG